MSEELVRISPSQYKLAKLCWRKWAFAYVLGLREGPSRATELGKRVHAILEAYIETNVVPDPNESWQWAGDGDKPRTFYPGRIALTMMQEGFPAPGEGLVEFEFEFVDRGVIWNGKIDWHEAVEGAITLMDHKTSSDPKKWGLTSEALADDVQAIIYARALLERYAAAGSSIDQVLALWNYGSTDAVASKARVAMYSFEPGEVYALFENEIVPFGQEIRRLKLLKADPLSLTPNPDACFAYHKQCPHAKACNLTTKDRIGALLMANVMLDSLLTEAAAQPGAAAQPPPAAADVVNPPEAAAAPPVAAPAAAVAPVAAPAAAVAPAAPPVAEPAKPRGRPRKTPAAPALSAVTTEREGQFAQIAADVAQLRKVDSGLADRVADKVAEAIATKLLGE